MGPLAVTMGEPGGVGGEITLITYARLRSGDLSGIPSFFAIDDPDRLTALAAHLGLDIPTVGITDPAETAQAFLRGLPVMALDHGVDATPGVASPKTATAVLASIDRAVSLCRSGKAVAMVTQPIQKEALYDAGFAHPGHTEYLAHICQTTQSPVMMLASPALRVVPVTIHQSLATVAGSLTVAAVAEAVVTTAVALVQDFGIGHPRIAVAGLNPHAGEGGRLGTEEKTIITPAMIEARAQLDSRLGRGCVELSGPLSADTMFHPAARARYDAAVCMYHDQALIPIKTLDFDHGVNVTLGLPVVRTSPDHGTALDIAGHGIARPDSFIEALRLAATMGQRRAERASQ